MAVVCRLTAIWSGFAGAPGYSKFSFLPLADDTARNAAGTALYNFFNAIKSTLPNGTTITVQPTVDEVDTITGELQNAYTMTSTPSAVTSTATAVAYAAGAGYIVTWNGTGVFNGRRIRGRTFIVPAVDCYATDGTLSPSTITTVQTAGAALLAAVGIDLAIWNRKYDTSTPPIPIAGNVTSATGCVVKDAATGLRSRRL